MDFLIAGAGFDNDLDAKDLRDAIDGAAHAVVHHCRGFSVGYSSSSDTYSCGSEVFLFSGVAQGPGLFVSGDVVSRGMEHLPVLYRNLDWKPKDVAGVFVVVRFDDTVFEVRVDTLSQYPIFYYLDASDSRKFVVSNNPYLIRSFVGRNRISITRSSRAIGEAFIFGTSFGQTSGFTQVFLAPPDTRFNLKVNQQLCIEPLQGAHEPKQQALTYDEAVRETADFLRESVNAYLEELGSHFNNVIDLTGGVDSRLVMAAIHACGMEKAVSVYCMGGGGSPDKLTFDCLVERYGYSPASIFVSNQESNLTFDEFLQRGISRFFGMKFSEFGDVGTTYIDRYSRATGYFGEFSRVFDEELIRADATPAELADAYLDKRRNEDLLVTGAAKDEFRTQLVEEISELQSNQQHEGAAIAREFYRRNRSRVHFGLTSRLVSATRIGVHPLATPRLAQLAAMLNEEDAKDNKVAFDLMSLLAGKEFALNPMASKAWPRRFFQSASRYKEYLEVGAIRPGQAPVAPPVSINTRHLGKSSRIDRIENGFTAAVRKQGKQYYWALLPSCFEVIDRRMREMDPNDYLFSTIDYQAAAKLLKAGYSNIQSNTLAKNCLRLAVALTWWQSGDSVFQIEKVVQDSDW